MTGINACFPSFILSFFIMNYNVPFFQNNAFEKKHIFFYMEEKSSRPFKRSELTPFVFL